MSLPLPYHHDAVLGVGVALLLHLASWTCALVSSVRDAYNREGFFFRSYVDRFQANKRLDQTLLFLIRWDGEKDSRTCD